MGLRVRFAILGSSWLPCHQFLSVPILAVLHHHSERLSNHLAAFASVVTPALKSAKIRLTLSARWIRTLALILTSAILVRPLEARFIVVGILVSILAKLEIFAVVLLPILVVVVVTFVRITSLHRSITALVYHLVVI